MSEGEKLVVVEFPLRGEWLSPNSPGTKVPSHGTEQLGQKYAYDFLQVDWHKKGMHFYIASKLRYFLFGIPLSKCLCWGKDIYAPCDGKVIECNDGYIERRIVHLISDLFVVFKNALTYSPKSGLQKLVGNYIIIQTDENTYAFFAHLKKNSIAVSTGDSIRKGQLLGKVGHSGNSTAPHLHFHLMDNSDLFKAKGIPCAFEKYEVYKDDLWTTVNNGIPTANDRFRFLG